MFPTQHTIKTPYLIGTVHCYSAEINNELILFDCGPPNIECREELRRQIDLPRVRHLLLTHAHIDHWGQARWLAEEFGITVYMPYHDSLKIIHHTERLNAMLHIMSEAGFSAQWLEEFAGFMEKDALYPSFPSGYLIAEEEVTKRFGIEVYRCAGHSTSDLVYKGGESEREEGWIISGDTLLPGVFQSPLLDVDLERGGRFRNYEAWCRSIVLLASLEGNRVLPGHRNITESVYGVLIWYLRTLLYRLKRFLPYREEENFAVIVEAMLAERIKGPFHIYFKASELIFIRDLLADSSRLMRALLAVKKMMEEGEYAEELKEMEKIIARFKSLTA